MGRPEPVLFRALRSILLIGGLFFSAGAVGLGLPDEEIHNSDILYAPALFRDLRFGVSIRAWSLTPAPYFFPDLALYFFSESLVRPVAGEPGTIDPALRLTAALLFLANALAFSLLLRRLVALRIESGLALWTATTSFFLLIPGLGDLFLGAMIPTNHSGLICGLFIFWALVASLNEIIPDKRSYLLVLLLWITVVAFGISDGQFLSLTAFPFLAFRIPMILWRFIRKTGPRMSFPLSEIAVLLAVLSIQRLIPIVRYRIAFFPPVDGLNLLMNSLALPPVALAFRFLARQGLAIPALGLVSILLVFLVVSVRSRYSGGKIFSRRLFVFLTGVLFSLLFGIGSIIVLQTGLEVAAARAASVDPASFPVGMSVPRYTNFLYGFFLPSGLSLLLIACFRRCSFLSGHCEKTRSSGWWVAIHKFQYTAAFLVSFLLAVFAFSVCAVKMVHREIPPVLRETACLDETLDAWYGSLPATHGTEKKRTGLSDYWHAKRLSLFSRSGARLLQVLPEDPGRLYFWINNLAWYMDTPRTCHYIVTDGLNVKKLRLVYGEPDRQHRCEGLDLWWYQRGLDHCLDPAGIRVFATVLGISLQD